MTRDPDMNQEFGSLLREIEEAERALRNQFTATPALDPGVLQQIKVRLRAEGAHLRPAQRAIKGWLRGLAATAATLLLATGFYAITRPAGGTAGSVTRSAPSLETFAASLPTVLSDEDSEITQLRSDLRQLEHRTAETAPDVAVPGNSATQRPGPGDDAPLADVYARPHDAGQQQAWSAIYQRMDKA